jgi:hypothetical protein
VAARTDELKATEQALISVFDSRCDTVLHAAADIGARGQFERAGARPADTAGVAVGGDPRPPRLAGPSQELVGLGLNTRAKSTLFLVRSDVEQLIAHLRHLFEISSNSDVSHIILLRLLFGRDRKSKSRFVIRCGSSSSRGVEYGMGENHAIDI